MKPAPFRYVRASTVADAVATLKADPDARILAGGQSLVPMMNLRVAQPSVLVDVNAVPELQGIRLEGGRLVCGSMARHAEVEDDETVADWLPLLGHLAGTIGFYPIRQRGTMGGSLAHADPAAQYLLAASLLDPEITLEGPASRRVVRGREFVLAPFETVMGPGEMLTEIRWPVQTIGTGWGSEAVRQRASDYAIVACLATISLDGAERIASAELALAGLAATPRHTGATNESLGGTGDAESLADSASRMIGAIEALLPAPPPPYRARVARVLAKRAMAAAVQRARATLQ